MRVASLRVTGLRVFYSFMEWEHHYFILTPRMLWSRYTFRKLRNVSIAAQRTNNRHQQNTSKLAALAARKTESWLKVNFWNATRVGSQVKSSQSPRWMAVWVTPRRVYSLTLKKPANSQTRNPHARSSVGRPLTSQSSNMSYTFWFTQHASIFAYTFRSKILFSAMCVNEWFIYTLMIICKLRRIAFFSFSRIEETNKSHIGCK